MFFRAQQVEQRARLAEVIPVFTVIPVVGGSFNAQRWLSKVRLLLEQAKAVWLVGRAVTAVAVHAHRAVAVVVVERAFCAVNRDLMMVNAQTVAVGVPV
ncbi:hypothetical protein D3C72_1649110 [compost metagenome]